MDHPDVERMQRTGNHKPIPRIYGSDALNNTVLSGQEILCLDDMYFLVDGLDQTAIEVLEQLGARYATAE